MIKTMYKGTGLTFASGSLVGVGCTLVQFVVYCVLFVMMFNNIARTLGQYADQELLKSLFQNNTPNLS